METKVLVAYATSYGSTQEIAEVISETLRSQGLAVDLQSIRKVRTFEGYSAVVLGAPLYMFHWLTPTSVEIVGGKFDPAKLRFPYNLIPVLKKMPTSDLRDWVAIRAWANSLAAQFLPDLPQ